MSRPNALILLAFLCAVIALMGGLTLFKGALLIAKHEGDTLHLLDMVSRMAAGERIHQDFVTPIGILAIAPLAAMLSVGLGYGHALIDGQILVALVLLPAIWWTVWTRLPGAVGYLTGAYLVVLILALLHGQAETSLSMSMHYNRWAWALAYIAILLAFLPPLEPASRPVSQTVDGLVIGLAMAAMALTKATYFAAFALPVALSLAMMPARRTLAVALIAGLAVIAVVTLWQGPGIWAAYLADLRMVADSASRERPGETLGFVLGSPASAGISFMLLLGVVLLRQARQQRAGLILLLLVPGFVYVTYQNYGNDPQWLVLLAAILLTLRPAPEMRNGWGWNLATAQNFVIVAVIAFASPSVLNLAFSPVRLMALDTSEYAPLLPRDPRNDDLLIPAKRAVTMNANVAIDGPGSGLEQFREQAEREDLVEIDGEELPVCELQAGLVGWFTTLAQDLTDAGYAGKAIYEADLLEALPLYGDFRPVRGAAPWHYGGAPGVEDADFILLPECPMAPKSRFEKIQAIAAAGIGLTEVRRTPLYRLFAKKGG